MEYAYKKFFFLCTEDYTSSVTGYTVKKGDIISDSFRSTFLPEAYASDFTFIGICQTTMPIGVEFTNNLRRLGQYPEIAPFKEYL
jgi:hypothetical protein